MESSGIASDPGFESLWACTPKMLKRRGLGLSVVSF